MLKFLSKNIAFSLLGFVFLFFCIFSLNASFSLAQTGYTANPESGGADSVAWGQEAGNFQTGTGLGNNDPRKIVTNIINIALGFLGILAIIIIMYAGFLWMMSGGNPDKINKAKHTLISGAIGLVIVLSSFAIASFILDAIFRATTHGSGGGGGTVPTSGSSCITLCAGKPVCIAGCSGGGSGTPGDHDLPCSDPTNPTTANGVCNPLDSICTAVRGSAWSCNTSTCLCEVTNMGSCFNPFEDACTYPCALGLGCYGDNGCNANACGSGNGQGCFCCCDPSNDQCGEIYPTLECRGNVSPCSDSKLAPTAHPNTASRGMCCGCTADAECGGNVALTACGEDTCCRERPKVIPPTVPADNAIDICTNPLISVQFDQAMKSDSLDDNFLIIGKYTNSCPDNTNLFDINDAAIPISGVAGFNYCNVKGSARVRNEAGKSYVDFIPDSFLDINTLYYIIVRGDTIINDDLNDGVQSYWGISMNGSYVMTDSEAPSFTTINDPETGGVCLIESVSLAPSSYLFRTTQNSIQEEDTDAASANFDIARDKDKLFVARAISSSKQVIAPINGYNWIWDMKSNNASVVKLNENTKGLNEDTSSGTALNNGMALAEAVEGITDGRSVISATINMDNFHVAPVNTIFDGDKSFDKSSVYVFVCDNPWPPVDTSKTPMWEPWNPDDPATAVNENKFNYDIYYCRDKLPKGTVDDLPAFDSAGVAGTPDTIEVLQQVYFAYKSPPPPGHITKVASANSSSYPDGGAVHLEWTGVNPAWVTANEAIGGYKVHWGNSRKNYSSHLDVGNSFKTDITDLLNGKRYYFSVSAYTLDKAESSYYIATSSVPYDTIATTSAPVLIDNDTVVGRTEVELYWKEIGGAYGYQLSYGLDNNANGAVIDVGNYTGVVIDPLSPKTKYYFQVRILDKAGNAGPPSALFSTTTLANL